MDFRTNTQIFRQFDKNESPFLTFEDCNQTDREMEYLNNDGSLWRTYTKLSPVEGTSVQLPAAMLESASTNNNSNFDGILDADTCSLDSFTNEDSSDMDTFSDVDLAESSEDEFCGAHSVLAQGCGLNGVNTPAPTFLPTTTYKIDDESAAQQQDLHQNLANNNIIIGTVGEDSERARARARGDFSEEFTFKLSKQEKAKPNLPEDALFQGSDLSSSFSSVVSEHVVHVEEHGDDEDCDCMYGDDGMYQTPYMQAQNSF